ncbi:gp53-like domain-containing protein [Phascolarctobacterium succinatutens]|uniref:gp53-like domain-containing protein n=1 Tax=Phascolarctobacterium succinatutens TaxID=626940 RepID=UPI003AEFF362
MAQSTTNLGKIHVFPSESLYNQFKDVIASNDLALLKDDGAYIVAALLAQNGYVKFSNGLILQWGVYTTGTRNVTITLPIATSVTYVVIAVARTENNYGCLGSQNCQYVSNVTNKTFQAGSYDSGNGYAGFWWMSIGKA